MSEPLPKELLIDAWNARVGYSLERCRTHAAYECQLVDQQARQIV